MLTRMTWLLLIAYSIGVYVQYYHAPGWVGLAVGAVFSITSPVLTAWVTKRRTEGRT
jgi:ABC-type uncharacterized transport system permease subunit